MLNQTAIVAFLATTDAAKARAFYTDKLGLTFVSDEPHAVVFDAAGTMLRIQKVESFTPQPFTALGWEVADIEVTVDRLVDRGIAFERFGFMQQDERGIWTTPGARIAWFKDPDGNTLSISQQG